MKIQTAFVLIAAVTSAAAMGCGSSSDNKPSDTALSTRASLHRAKGCGDLLTDLKADATYKLNKGIDQQIESIQKCLLRNNSDQNCAYGGYIGGGRGGGGFGEATSDASQSNGAPSPSGFASGVSLPLPLVLSM